MTDTPDDERQRALMRRVHDDPTPKAPTDAMWPAIRSRIEAAKVEHLGQTDGLNQPRRRRWLVPSLALVAAAVTFIAVALTREHRSVGPQTITYTYSPAGPVILASDSTSNYEEETRVLLNDLELRRSMLRPEAVAAIDHDLRVVDSAIAEVKDALKNDPNNPALRRLLASSYREKLSVLQRVGNAG